MGEEKEKQTKIQTKNAGKGGNNALTTYKAMGLQCLMPDYHREFI